MSLDFPLFPINAISFVPGRQAGLNIPSIFNLCFVFFPDFKSTIKRASDFPDFAAKATFLLSSDQVIPGLRICNSSNSEFRSP